MACSRRSRSAAASPSSGPQLGSGSTPTRSQKGQAVVIKIGQGAKPGIGGHLPGVKVTTPISETRRIPIGTDAISPAPHHDIYSIEDLGQRILGLKEATKKPVFVKVGATNYIPYIASGVARMGAAGIIIDGAGAGTGAAPSIVKNNVGVPIELAVASVDAILRKEGLRDDFTVIAAGRVSCPEDSLKLIALGADITSVGTGALLAIGCLMVHKCHLGFCPAILTNKISDSPVRTLSMDQSVTLARQHGEGMDRGDEADNGAHGHLELQGAQVPTRPPLPQRLAELGDAPDTRNRFEAAGRLLSVGRCCFAFKGSSSRGGPLGLCKVYRSLGARGNHRQVSRGGPDIEHGFDWSALRRGANEIGRLGRHRRRPGDPTEHRPLQGRDRDRELPRTGPYQARGAFLLHSPPRQRAGQRPGHLREDSILDGPALRRLGRKG